MTPRIHHVCDGESRSMLLGILREYEESLPERLRHGALDHRTVVATTEPPHRAFLATNGQVWRASADKPSRSKRCAAF